MKSRQYSALDNIIIALDNRLKAKGKSSTEKGPERPYPAADLMETHLNEEEKSHISGLMRVNHAGEIAAQALYKAQALTARKSELKLAMQQAADEEIDHLHWCKTRLRELDGHTSHLEPVWSFGSFGIGLVAGCFGDKWNLGFLAETEYQVVRHLDSHLKQIPERDQRSRAILEQMREDELQHATTAETAGAKDLPITVKKLMGITSKVMTKTAYWV